MTCSLGEEGEREGGVSGTAGKMGGSGWWRGGMSGEGDSVWPGEEDKGSGCSINECWEEGV